MLSGVAIVCVKKLVFGLQWSARATTLNRIRQGRGR